MDELLGYGMLTLSTVMFGSMFLFNDIYRREYGSDLQAAMVSGIGGGLFGFVALLVIKATPIGFSALFQEIVGGFSAFSLTMALLSALNGVMFTVCTLKALGKINLSLYSLFSMLGGMVLPFFSGILCHSEPFTFAKAVCFVTVAAALFIVAERDSGSECKIYYVGVFVFNGMSGVIAKMYQALPFEKMDSSGYSMLKAVMSISLCVVILLFIKRDTRRLNRKCIAAMAGSGVLGNVANWLVLVALYTLPASAQYPFITGGTMVVSTAICGLRGERPSRNEMLSVALAFVGILLLVLLPELEIFTINWR